MTVQRMEQMETPALLLDEARMDRNIARMRSRMQRLGVAFRPHVKTNKCIDVARRMMATPEGTITVRGQSDVAGLATLVVNGKAVEPDATGAFAARVTLSPGDNQIYARAVDTDGHTYADAVYLTWPVPEATLAAGSTAGCAAAGADPLALLFAAGAALALHGRRRRHPAFGTIDTGRPPPPSRQRRPR